MLLFKHSVARQPRGKGSKSFGALLKRDDNTIVFGSLPRLPPGECVMPFDHQTLTCEFPRQYKVYASAAWGQYSDQRESAFGGYS